MHDSRTWRWVAALGLAVVSLVVATRSLPSPPAQSLIERKLEELRQIQHRVNVLFVGSSYIYRHIDPVVFDEVLSSHGVDAVSYNLGLPGATLYEMHWLLRELKKMPFTRLKWVLVALDGRSLKEANADTYRWTQWHEVEETPIALGALYFTHAGKKLSRTERMSWGLAHLKSFLRNSLDIGRHSAANWTEGLRAIEHRRVAIADHRRGFKALKADENSGVRKRRDKFIEKTQAFEKRVNRLRKQPISERLRVFSAYEERIALDILEGVRQLAAAPVSLIPPLIQTRVLSQQLRAVVAPEISFMDMEAYADLFDSANRFDANHLSEKGAGMLSTELAHRLFRIDSAAQTATLNNIPKEL